MLVLPSIRKFRGGLLALICAGIAVVLVALAALALLGQPRGTLEERKGQKVAAGFLHAVRAGDRSACGSMVTPAGRRDLVYLLTRAGATGNCGEALANSSAQVRLAALRPFSHNNAIGEGGGGALDGSQQEVFFDLRGGRCARIVMDRHGDDGLLVSKVRVAPSGC